MCKAIPTMIDISLFSVLVICFTFGMIFLHSPFLPKYGTNRIRVISLEGNDVLHGSSTRVFPIEGWAVGGGGGGWGVGGAYYKTLGRASQKRLKLGGPKRFGGSFTAEHL